MQIQNNNYKHRTTLRAQLIRLFLHKCHLLRRCNITSNTKTEKRSYSPVHLPHFPHLLILLLNIIITRSEQRCSVWFDLCSNFTIIDYTLCNTFIRKWYIRPILPKKLRYYQRNIMIIMMVYEWWKVVIIHTGDLPPHTVPPLLSLLHR